MLLPKFGIAVEHCAGIDGSPKNIPKDHYPVKEGERIFSSITAPEKVNVYRFRKKPVPSVELLKKREFIEERFVYRAEGTLFIDAGEATFKVVSRVSRTSGEGYQKTYLLDAAEKKEFEALLRSSSEDKGEDAGDPVDGESSGAGLIPKSIQDDVSDHQRRLASTENNSIL